MRKNYSSGSAWEDKVGYSRAVRVGNTIEIAGTVAIDSKDNLVGKDDPYEQSLFILNKIIDFVEKAGAKKEDIIRTRIYVVNISQWKWVGMAHGEIFKDVKPVTTMVEVSKLISDDFLVEIEATAIIS